MILIEKMKLIVKLNEKILHKILTSMETCVKHGIEFRHTYNIG